MIFCSKLGDAAGKKRTVITEERGKSQESYASYRMTHLRITLHRITRFGFRKLFGSDFNYERALLQTWMYPPLSRYASKNPPAVYIGIPPAIRRTLPPPFLAFLNLFHNVALLRIFPWEFQSPFFPLLPFSSCRNAETEFTNESYACSVV